MAKGSTPVFVIALIIFADAPSAETTAKALQKVKSDCGFPVTAEFKYHKSRDAIKTAFFSACTTLPFTIRAIVVHKSDITSNFLRTHTGSFYNYFIMQVLKHSGNKIKDARLKFDKRGEKRIRDELRAYLSTELNTTERVFTDLKFVDSQTNILIQLADMVAGCIGAHAKGNDHRIFELLKPHIDDIWRFS